jgi:uncharacterized protein YqeY
MTAVEQLKSDLVTAMKAGEKERVGALRMVLSALQLDEKEGGGDEVAVLRRERKRRLDAAEQYREAGRPELAEPEEAEARMIEGYLPAEMSDDELERLVRGAVAETGASSVKEMGAVMKAVMPAVAGRADGKRVSATVREVLGAAG